MIRSISAHLEALPEAPASQPTSQDVIGFIKAITPIMILLIEFRMKFPYRKAHNKVKWERWLWLLRSGSMIVPLIKS